MSESLEKISNALAFHYQEEKESAWLEKIGLIESRESTYELAMMHDWHMPGSESYIFDFEIRSESLCKRAVIKACIKAFSCETVDEWMRRRQRLIDHGIETPALYSRERAEYIEEYIPYDLATLLRENRNTSLHKKLEQTKSAISEAGFIALSYHDLRSRGDDVVVIDFGADLGSFKSTQTDHNT